jgi:adenosylcobinamide-GDP ribazoletransferase
LPAVWLLSTLPYVTPDAAAKSRGAAQAGIPQSALATLWTLAILVAVITWGGTTPTRAAVLLVSGVLVALVCGRRFHQRVGGVTGDLLGSTVVVSECVMWLAVGVVS